MSSIYSYDHHIIPKHEWLSRFGNLKGIDSMDNIVRLTLEQHAQVHLHYFNEITHIEYDKIASMAISGQIKHEEATRLAGICANKGKKWTEERKLAQAVRMRGKQIALGKKMPPRTKEYREELSIKLMGHRINLGRKHTEEHNQTISISMMGNQNNLGKKRGPYKKTIWRLSNLCERNQV